MAKKEKFGKFVLLEEIDTSGLGTEYRAAKLGPTGFEKIVTVLRLTPALSANAEGVKLLMDQVKFAAQLQNPNIIKILGIGGKVGSPCWVSYEFFDGKNLKAVFARCRQEGFPFSIDHALLIASKVSTALEYAHARKTEAGGRYFHGFVTPANVLVSYEGEVRLRGFGYWPARVRELGAVSESDALYLAPEQAAGTGDSKSDMFSVGALLFEMLTGEPLRQPGKPFDPSRVTGAKLQSTTTDDDAIPKPIREILQKSLAADPAARYAEIHDMRKAVDALLFSGDFSPTTFNLAFFMHSLFRDDIDRETTTLKEEREATYLDFMIEDTARPPAPGAPAPAATAVAATAPAPAAAAVAAVPAPTVVLPRPAPAVAAPSAPRPVAAAVSAAAPVAHAPAAAEPVHRREEPPPPPPPEAAPVVETPVVPPETQPFVPPVPPRERDAAAGFTFHKGDAVGGSNLPLFVGIGVLVLALGAGTYFLLGRRGSSAPAPVATAAPTTTLSPETVAAMAKVKELEEKLAAIEAEKAAAAAKAEEGARKKLEAQAAARGQAVDPAALQKAQDEARRKSEAEQARKQQEEKKRLEDEQKAAEARLAEERRKEEEARIAAAATAATTLPPATQPPAPPPTAPALKPGTLVQLSDPGVIAPVPLATPALQYPPIALARRIEGKVEVSVLVDERGTVADTKLVSGAGGKSGLNEAALENARRRRYRPASKDGVPVKVWVPVTVNFMLPK